MRGERARASTPSAGLEAHRIATAAPVCSVSVPMPCRAGRHTLCRGVRTMALCLSRTGDGNNEAARAGDTYGARGDVSIRCAPRDFAGEIGAVTVGVLVTQ